MTRIFVVIFTILSFPAFGQDSFALPEWILSAGVPLLAQSEPAPTGWEATVLLANEMMPRYAGSRAYRFEATPLFDIRYKDIYFISAIEGLGVNLSQSKSHRLGIALTYDLGRSEDAAPILRGLGGINATPEVKVFADYVVYPIVFRMDIRRALGGYSGLVADVAGYLPLYASDNLVSFIGPSLTWSNRTTLGSYFGISPAQSAATGLPQYQLGAGLRSAGFGADVTWTIHNHWILNAAGGIQRFTDHIYQSPLVQTRLESAVSISGGYAF